MHTVNGCLLFHWSPMNLRKLALFPPKNLLLFSQCPFPWVMEHHLPCWSDLRSPPRSSTTAAWCGPCCSRRSPLSSEGWTYVGVWARPAHPWTRRTASARNQLTNREKMLAMSKERGALYGQSDSRRLKNSSNVTVLGALRIQQLVATLTYCVTIQSGGTSEYPEADKCGNRQLNAALHGKILRLDRSAFVP